MSGVKRWDHAVRWEGMKIAASYMAIKSGGKYVLASDYDKLACSVDPGRKLTMDAACGEIAALEAERDALRAQVEAMQYALNHILVMQTRCFITLGDNATSMANDALQANP